MIYKFKSKAAGDVIMLGASGDQLLRIIGKEPAATGIVQADSLAAAMAAIEQAVAADDAARGAAKEGDATARRGDGVSLRQRAWPLLEMMKRSQADGSDVVWGV